MSDRFKFAKRSVPIVKDVKVDGHEVLCACGTSWLVSPVDANGKWHPTDDVCPDCSAPPRPGTVGPLATFEYDVPLTLGPMGPGLVLAPGEAVPGSLILKPKG